MTSNACGFLLQRKGSRSEIKVLKTTKCLNVKWTMVKITSWTHFKYSDLSVAL